MEILLEAQYIVDNWMFFGYDEQPGIEMVIEHLNRV